MGAQPRGKILIVDDSEIIRDSARLTLEQAGFSVITSDSPLGVSLIVRKESPDLVLIDISMPALSGDKLARLLRDRLAKPGVRIVLFSNKSESDLRSLHTTSGADGYIRKTPDPMDLVRGVQRALAAEPVSGR